MQEPQLQLSQSALRLAEVLKSADRRVVFAESCTAGLVSATLGAIPGISEYLCGSAVTYRNDTKIRWLEVPANTIRHAGPVSGIVARHMAAGVLENTPEADLAVSITGHLGPNAPEGIDGVVFIGVAVRHEEPESTRHTLPPLNRSARQHLAAALVLEAAHSRLADRVDE